MEPYFKKEQRDVLFTGAFCESLYPLPPPPFFFQHSLSPEAFIKKIKKGKKTPNQAVYKSGGSREGLTSSKS